MIGLIYLFRHCQSTAPMNLMVGQANFGLSANGRHQAQLWGSKLAEIHFTLTLSSPLSRSIQTAELILSRRQDNAPVRIERSLREISLGCWEGRSKDWVRQQYPQDWEARGRDPVNHPPPGGESLAALDARVWPAFQKLALEAAGHQNTLIVAHQAIIRVILTHLPGQWPDNPLDIEVPPAALSILAVSSDGRIECRKPPRSIEEFNPNNREDWTNGDLF